MSATFTSVARGALSAAFFRELPVVFRVLLSKSTTGLLREATLVIRIMS